MLWDTKDTGNDKCSERFPAADCRVEMPRWTGMHHTREPQHGGLYQGAEMEHQLAFGSSMEPDI